MSEARRWTNWRQRNPRLATDEEAVRFNFRSFSDNYGHGYPTLGGLAHIQVPVSVRNNGNVDEALHQLEAGGNWLSHSVHDPKEEG